MTSTRTPHRFCDTCGLVYEIASTDSPICEDCFSEQIAWADAFILDPDTTIQAAIQAAKEAHHNVFQH